MITVGIAGGSGYGGTELIQCLLRHSETEIWWLSSGRHAGSEVGELYPHLRGFLKIPFSRLDEIPVQDLDILFLALPHGEAMKVVPGLPEGLRVIDLSGDFRIREPEVFEEFYGFPLSGLQYQRGFVYGLPEVNREKIQFSRRVANPGCFATATLIALYPLYQEGWIDGPVFVDSKTGSSGAGRNPTDKTHHPRRSHSLFPYKPFCHQHLPEMRQLLSEPENPLVFQPHSAPFIRGIFASHYMRVKLNVNLEKVRTLYQDYYGDEPFVRWVPGCPDVSSVQHSNFVDLGAAFKDGFLIVWSAIDNLQKGAAGQAVQNMNLIFGLEETLGLEAPPSFP
jgi:N-acetyl-gamma-glutamyl-phosphate reductase